MTSLLSVEALAHQRFVTVLMCRMIREKTRRRIPLGWSEVERPEQLSGPDRNEEAERLYAVASKLRSLVYGRVDNPELKKAINEALKVPATGVATRTRWSHLAQLVVLAQGSDLALDRYFRRADVVETWGLLEDDATEVSLDIPAIVKSLKDQKAEPDLSERFREKVEPHHKMVAFFNLPDLTDEFVTLLTDHWAKLDDAIARSCAEPWELIDEVTVRIARELQTMGVLLSRSQIDTIVYFLTYRATGARLGRQPFFRDYKQYRGRLSGSSLREGMRMYRDKWIKPLIPPGALDDLNGELDAYEAKLPAPPEPPPLQTPPSEAAETDL